MTSNLSTAQRQACENFASCTETTLQYGGYEQANDYAAWATAQLAIRGQAAQAAFAAWWLTHPAHLAQ